MSEQDGNYILFRIEDGVLVDFYGKNENLDELVIPDGIVKIGSDSLANSKFRRVVFPDRVEDIDSSAFLDCKNLESVVIPSSVKNVGDRAFCGCDALRDVCISDGVARIGRSSFSSCPSLKKIFIPKSVEFVDPRAFEGSEGLIEIDADENNPFYASADGNLYTKGRDCLVCAAAAKAVEIPSGCLTVGDHAFSRRAVEEVKMPDGVGVIGDGAFEYCHDLRRVEMPDSVTSIGEYAFCSCGNLESVRLSRGLVKMGEVAFWYCGSLKSIYIPDSVKSIGHLPFMGCDALESIEVDPRNPYFCSMDGILYRGVHGAFVLLTCPARKDVKSFVVPDGVYCIDDFAFAFHRNVEKLVVSEGVMSIGNYAFSERFLKSVVLPKSLRSIGDGAFRDTAEGMKVYYSGTPDDWLNIQIKGHNGFSDDAEVYFYSETRPETEGRWWHRVDGEPEAWTR